MGLHQQDAAAITGLGFNMVRLGIIWAGIEPGTLKANNPAICTPGLPQDPHQWNPVTASRYLSKVQQTVDLLGRYHVYTLLDMHEDVYSTGFRGEGAPDWAVCTNGLPIKTLPGRWSNNYASPSLNAAVRNFWKNDVVGDIQGGNSTAPGEPSPHCSRTTRGWLAMTRSTNRLPPLSIA